MALFETSFFSACYQRLVRMNVLLPVDLMLPPGTPVDRGPYKTLYLLHGYRGNCDDWLQNSQIREISELFGLAVVMPSGYNGFYVDQPRSGIRGSEFIGHELVDFTRKMFPLSPKREDTIIAGLSMGGWGALYNSLKHGDVFGHSIAMSIPVNPVRYESEHEPADLRPEWHSGYFEALHGDLTKIHETDRNLALHAKMILDAGAPVTDLYMACGYNDSLVPENRELHEQLLSVGFPHVYEEGSGTHEWLFWDEFLRRGLAHVRGYMPEPLPHPFWVEKTDYAIEGGVS